MTVSYSQYSLYSNCPHLWDLTYVKKVIPREQSVHTVFGTAIHEAIQDWLKVLYSGERGAVKQSNLHLTEEMFRTRFDKYSYPLNITNNQFNEFVEDGIAIIQFLKKKRAVYFNNKNIEIYGIERYIKHKVVDEYDVNLIGYVDVILRDKVTNKFTIIDIKTSTKGWSKFDKSNDVKTSQLLIYKLALSHELCVPIEDIDVYFFIVKRKVPDDPEFASMGSRIQKFAPPSGKVKMNMIKKELTAFITSCFDKEGGYLDVPKMKTGLTHKHCNFCPCKDNETLCKKEERI